MTPLFRDRRSLAVNVLQNINGEISKKQKKQMVQLLLRRKLFLSFLRFRTTFPTFNQSCCTHIECSSRRCNRPQDNTVRIARVGRHKPPYHRTRSKSANNSLANRTKNFQRFQMAYVGESLLHMLSGSDVLGGFDKVLSTCLWLLPNRFTTRELAAEACQSILGLIRVCYDSIARPYSPRCSFKWTVAIKLIKQVNIFILELVGIRIGRGVV